MAQERETTDLAGASGGVPYTLVFPGSEGSLAADLEYPAALPRVGDIVTYIDAAGAATRFRVSEVVHTVQSSAASRPAVEDGSTTPNAVQPDPGPAEEPGGSGLVRAGLPSVLLERID